MQMVVGMIAYLKRLEAENKQLKEQLEFAYQTEDANRIQAVLDILAEYDDDLVYIGAETDTLIFELSDDVVLDPSTIDALNNVGCYNQTVSHCWELSL